MNPCDARLRSPRAAWILGLGLAGAAFAAPVIAQDTPAPGTDQQAPAASEERIAELIRQLGHSDYASREQAQKDLLAIGAPALSALREATQSDDPEVAARAAEAVARIEGSTPGTRLRPVEPEQDPLPGADPRDPLNGLRALGDMDEVMRDLQRQLNEQLGGQFGDLFEPFLEQQEGQTENGRFRTFRWSFGGPRSPGDAVAAKLGLRVGAASPALRTQLDLPADRGLVVEALSRNGVGAQAGLQQYDVILSLDGKPVRTPQDLQPALTLGGELEVVRKAKRQAVTLRPGGAGEPQQGLTRPRAPTPAPQPEKPGERSF